jgi:hypothetical protein
MTQADHYRDQATRARRLAETVSDPEASKKLIEMAEEFRLYAERLEETQQVFPDGAGRSLGFHLPSVP